MKWLKLGLLGFFVVILPTLALIGAAAAFGMALSGLK